LTYAPDVMQAKLRISGNFEFRDADGNVVKVMHLSGAIPLSELGLTEEQAQALVDENKNNNGEDNGSDHRERVPEGGA
jgi:hypothetical protein